MSAPARTQADVDALLVDLEETFWRYRSPLVASAWRVRLPAFAVALRKANVAGVPTSLVKGAIARAKRRVEIDSDAALEELDALLITDFEIDLPRCWIPRGWLELGAHVWWRMCIAPHGHRGGHVTEWTADQ